MPPVRRRQVNLEQVLRGRIGEFNPFYTKQPAFPNHYLCAELARIMVTSAVEFYNDFAHYTEIIDRLELPNFESL